MYFWKVDDLVADLRDNNVTPKEEMKYLICWCLLAWLSLWFISALPSEDANIYEHASWFFSIFISVLGIYACYRVNSEGDGKDFITRMICLSIPVVIRVSVLCLPFLLLGFGFGLIEEEYNLLDVVFSVVFSFVYVWYLYQKMKAVSI